MTFAGRELGENLWELFFSWRIIISEPSPESLPSGGTCQRIANMGECFNNSLSRTPQLSIQYSSPGKCSEIYLNLRFLCTKLKVTSSLVDKNCWHANLVPKILYYYPKRVLRRGIMIPEGPHAPQPSQRRQPALLPHKCGNSTACSPKS